MTSSAGTGGEKRKMHADEEVQGTVVEQQLVLKKQRTDTAEHIALVAVQPSAQALVATGAGAAPPRSSSLQAATMCLTGHGAAVYCAKFSPSGRQLASAGGDKLLFLWDVAPSGEVANTHALAGHEGPILDLAWSGTDTILTASADKTAAVWSVETGERVKRMRGHQGIVNSVDVTRRGNTLAVTGSDDCSARVWDLRARLPVHQFVGHYQILSSCFSDDATQIFTAGMSVVHADWRKRVTCDAGMRLPSVAFSHASPVAVLPLLSSNDIQCWDLRAGKILYNLLGHRDSVTGLSLSPDGSYLLSNGQDSTLRIWDVRPYVAAPTRQTSLLRAHTHDLEQNLLRCSWSADGLKVACGSADKAVNVWEASSGRILYRLPGHKACVNEVSFHPTEPIIVSASSDKTMWIGEL